MRKYISINGHTIRGNAIRGTSEPPIRIAKSRSDAKPTYASEIKLSGNVRLEYSPRKPIMRCGARLVLVADEVEVVR